MNDWHLEDAFAPVPPVVRDHLDEALTQMRRMNRKRRKPALALVLAVVLILALVGGAVATGVYWNTFDFFARGYRVGAALPEARDMLQTDIPQTGGVTDDVVFTVLEALCDGRNAYLVFEARPTREDTLLVTGQMLASAAANRFFPELPEDQSLAGWAEANGYTRIVALRLIHDRQAKDGFTLEQTTARRQPDGSYRFMLAGRFTWPTVSDITFICRATTRWKQDGTPTEYEMAELTATIEPGSAPLWKSEWTGQAQIPETDITVEKVKLTGTAVATYAEITVHARKTDKWLFLVDEEGNALKWSAGTGINWESGVGSLLISMSNAGTNRYRYLASYEAMAEAPKTLRISTRDGYGVWPETVEIDME